MTIDEKIQQALNAPDDCGYARLAKDLARFLQESRAPAVTSADDGWISWAGGECPVNCGVRVEAKARNGVVWTGYNAGAFCWRHPNTRGSTGCDIVAYKVVT